MENFKKISRRIEQFRDEMIDMQLKLGSEPAISPSSGGKGEVKKAEILQNFLKDNGFHKIDLIKAPDLDAPEGYRPNILAFFVIK